MLENVMAVIIIGIMIFDLLFFTIETTADAVYKWRRRANENRYNDNDGE